MDSFTELTIIYKKGVPDFAFYRGQTIVFSKHRVAKNKYGYVAGTDDDYMVVHGANNCVAVMHDKHVEKWIERERVSGTDNSTMVHYISSIKSTK